MDSESVYETASERSLPSSDTGHSDCKKKPCQICGSNANEHLLMTCFRCRDTREHIYCARVFLPSVPPIWLCEVCRSSSRVLTLNPEVGEDSTADLRTNHADNDEEPTATATSRSRTNRVDDDHNTTSDSCDDTSPTNQPSQSQAHTSPVVEEASSPVSMDLPSDSESAK